MTTIELAAMTLFGHHGVGEEERERGQTFVFDLWLELAEPPAADRIEDTVDYRRIAACVREVSEGRRFHLLETLAAALADELIDRFPLESVRVRVRKPEVRLDPPVDYSAVTVERSRHR